MSRQKSFDDRLAPFVLAVVVCLVAAGCIALTRESGRIAAIWPVNAIVVSALLVCRRRHLHLMAAALVGNIAANLAVGDSPAVALWLAIANLVEICLIWRMLRRTGAARLERPSGLLIMTLSAVSACVASTGIAVASLSLLGQETPTVQTAVLWFAADFLGILIFTPLLVTLWRTERRFERAPIAASGLWAFAALIVVTAAVFAQSRFPLLFVPPAILTLVAIRTGFKGAAAGVLLIGVIALAATATGHGPVTLSRSNHQQQVVMLQAFLATLTLISLTVGAVSAERRRMIARLKADRRKRLAKSAREKKLLIQGALAEELSEIGYWTLDAVSGRVFWSPQVYRIHGVAPAAYNPGLEDALDFYVPEDRKRVAALIERSTAEGADWSFNATLVRRSDGELRFVHSVARCRRDANGAVISIFGVIKDLTDERALVSAIVEQERRYRLLADNSTDVIAVYGLDGTFSYLSPSVAELLGYTPEEMLGKKPYDFMEPEDHEATQAAFKAGLAAGAPFSVEYRMITRDGTVRWLEARPRANRDAAGQVIEVIDSVRDVTLRRQREAEVAEARAIAEAATRAKSEFLASMSHEIRTPLNGVLGFADVLAKTPLSSDQTHYVDRICAAGRGLASLIDDILDYSKIEAGKLAIAHAPLNLANLVDEIVDLVRSGSKNDLHFSLHYSEHLPPWVLGDEQRLRQVLLNLLGNAAKFTSKGTVQLFVSENRGDLEFRVVDSGVGIAPEVIGKLFDGFVQADSSTSRRYGGTGLGLVISRSLARLMDGDVWLDSEFGHGTTANFVLPYAPALAPRQAAAGPAIAPRPLRILAVDDVEANLELITILLASAGHHVQGVGSAEAALDRLSGEAAFDVVLMDVQMPGLDGLEATRIIRRSPGPASRLPIIALTANVMAEQVAACRAAGMDDHVGKPIKEAELIRALARVSWARKTSHMRASEAPDALAQLKLRYIDEMASIHAELQRLKSLEPRQSLPAMKALAHSVAGTAGSFGFDAVSAKAFVLEAAAASAAPAGRKGKAVGRAIADLLTALDEAT